MFIRTVFSVFFTLLVGVNSANAQTTKTKLPYYISNPSNEGRGLNVLPVWEHIQKSLGERSLPPPTKLVVMDGGVAANDDITCLAAGDSKSFLSGGFMAKDPLYDRIPHGTGLAGIVCAEPGEVSTGLLPKEVVSVLVRRDVRLTGSTPAPTRGWSGIMFGPWSRRSAESRLIFQLS